MAHQELILDGVTYPSVTTVLSWPPKEWLTKWREKWGRRAEQKTYEATEVGRKFHKHAEELAKGEATIYKHTRRLERMLGEFGEWCFRSKLKVKETELHVVSKKFQYQGTFDATGYLGDDKSLYIFDWKTSSGIYPDMGLQLSAYAQAYYEQMGVRIKKGYIVHVSKDKPRHKLTVKEFKLEKPLFNKFLKRLSEYRYYNEA